MDDSQLIRQFVEEKSETAFAELVRRHVDLVYSAALRVTRQPHLAEDVSQAVFILLARKAPAFSTRTIIPGWLYRTTQFVAARAIRSEMRRQQREQEAFAMQQISSPTADAWQNLEPALEEAMAQLSANDRDAIVLRYFQDEPLHNVGAKMGISEEAARKRVDRSLQKLQGILNRKGVTVPAGVLGAILVAHSVSAAPATLATGFVTTALAKATVAPAVSALVKQALNTWRLATGLKVGLTVLGLIVAVSLVSTTKHRQSFAATAVTNAQTTARAVRPGTAPTDSATADAGNLQTAEPAFSFRAVDAETGRAVAGAKVIAMTGSNMQDFHSLTNLFTDRNGYCPIPLNPSNVMGLVVGVLADGYQERSAFLGIRGPVPSEYTLRLPPGSTIGGIVQDAAGNPARDANIFVQFLGLGDSDVREFQRERAGIADDDLIAARTDSEGRWRFASASKSNADFWISVKQPGFPDAGFYIEESGAALADGSPRLKIADLYAGTAVLRLKSGVGLRGVVLDEGGNAISNATIAAGVYSQGATKTTSAADGSFQLIGLPLGQMFLTVTAPTYAPERTALEIDTNTAPVTFHLKRGAWLRLRVVDESGKPVSGTDVRLQGWQGNNSLDWGGVTDDEGRLEWLAAPHGQLDLFAGKQGFFYSRQNYVVPDGAEHTITLRRQLVVSGFVVDSETKQPIPHFKVIPGGGGNWLRSEMVEGTNGDYRVTFDELRAPLELRVEADGYDTHTSPAFSLSPREAVYHVQLEKMDPENRVHGIVLTPDGTAAAGVPVALCSADNGVTLGKGKFLDQHDSMIVRTDSEGRFVFPSASRPKRVVAVTSSAFGQATLTASNHSATIQLQPWGRIEGHLTVASRSNSEQKIALMSRPSQSDHENIDFNLADFTVKTDAQGNFVFDQAPPGEFSLYWVPGLYIPFSKETPTTVPAGQTVHAEVGGNGTAVKGKLTCAAGGDIDWSKQVSMAHFSTKMTPLLVPAGLSEEQRAKWRQDYWESEEGRERAKLHHTYAILINADGSFTLEDVVPGTYVVGISLSATAVNRQDPRRARLVARLDTEVVIPPGDDGHPLQTFDLGTFTLKPTR